MSNLRRRRPPAPATMHGALCAALCGLSLAAAPATRPSTRPDAAPDERDALRREVTALKGRLEASEQQRDALTEQVNYYRAALRALEDEINGGPGGPHRFEVPKLRRVGTVTRVQQTDAGPEAVLPLGAADGVKKGTRFQLVDATGQQFLGYVTVESIEEHESLGRLTGPKVSAVGPTSVLMASEAGERR